LIEEIIVDSTRVAWLLPSAFFYWHPPISHFVKRFPKTTVFTGRWRGYAKGFEDAFQVEMVGDRKVFSLIPAKTGYGISFTYVSLGIVGKLLSLRPQVIFTNSFGVWSIVALLLKPMMGWRVVLAYEGSSPSVDFRNSPIRLAIRRIMVRLTNACITNSREGKAYLMKYLKVDEHRIFVQPYEVPATEALCANSVSIAPVASKWQHPVFLYVGQIIPRKGLNLLLDACERLKEQGRDRFTIVVVGDGAQRAELEAYAQEKGISECVQWIGRVDYDCLGSYFAEADAFVLPTLEDTWGMVVLEAMALETAIICSCFAGASDLVTDGDNGFVIDPKDTKALAAAMEQFITEPALGDRLGLRAAMQIAKYSPEVAGEFMTKVADFVLRQ
jgi:glycosyltransferase involved in cell wall biosynthesis